MKYRECCWNLMIDDEQASCNDTALDFIAEEIERGNTSGVFGYDDTDYNLVDKLKDELETKLGRNVDFSVEDDDKGELDDLLDIAKKHKDYEIANIIKDILYFGF